NGADREVFPDGIESLAETLRSRLHLTGTKVACGRGECGACTVLLDGRPVYACLTITNACEGAAVTTIEGLAAPGGLHPVHRTRCGPVRVLHAGAGAGGRGAAGVAAVA
ncbi:2Fe-2S iron-sulfur cluster-binding protein, partial [Myxococcota bacterium]|nr:2Fe-2S iron-sulfur cluster-binding protein [Myxococcota bacterium]